MCGIAGFVNFDHHTAAEELIGAMNRVQAHRGPDGAGFFIDDRAALGHRRLAIIDLEGGIQPMSNEDGSLHLVFNGEIYNHRELRARLETSGHRFRTGSDTEVILHLYEECGADAPAALCGMFAFALWDSRKRMLLLGRDRAGQKPLVYFRKGRTLVFASEINALREHPDFPEEWDARAVGDFLSLQYVPSPDCIYREVKKLPPAHTLLFNADSGQIQTACYWQMNVAPKGVWSFPAASQRLRELLTEAVRKRLMAEVPSGAFLSGGLDSAIIATLMTRLRQPERTAAFTIGFADRAYDERSGARLAAHHINRLTGNCLDHQEKVVDPGDFELLRKLVPCYGEPFADASMLPTALLSAFAREQVTVILSGDGADEIFAGYERYLAMRLASRFNRLPEPVRRMFFRLPARFFPDSGERTFSGRLRRLLRMLGAPQCGQYFALLDRCPPALRARIAGERLLQEEAETRRLFRARTAFDVVEQCMEIDFHTYLPGDILPKVDIASMASSLEVRNPFLDHELIEFAATLPSEFKLCGRSRKHLLKHAFADLLPQETIAVRKRGFGVPLASWLRGRWQEPALAALWDSPLPDSGWIDPKGLQTLWNEHQQGRRDHSYLLWSLLILALFMQKRS